MIKIHTRYITDAKGKPLEVVLPVKEFKALLKRLEEVEDALELERAIEKQRNSYLGRNLKRDCRSPGRSIERMS